ncbi:S8 family serine peptidase [Streptomyces sp. NPDC004134]|uniref:S8 family peptidase n=1 Tax=Streptomyces sp. NPDC004134 TaxID=3364691 RepID=UPI0036B0F155
MHPSPRRHLRRRAALLGCAGMLLAAVPSAATALPEPSASQRTASTTAAGAAPAAPAASASASPAVTGAPEGTAITLLTGDTVTFGPVVAGRPTFGFTPAGESGGSSYTTFSRRGGLYVVPDDVAGLVPRVLDPELFNVSALAAMDYDDAATGSLPLIVSGPRPLAALDGAGDTRALPSIDATAVEMPKDRAADFADRLTDPAGPRAAAGVTKVWLDGRLEADELDWNLGMIGAPEAWGAGLSGAGVDVAVLDSGVDADHPDLRGQVAAAADFTGSGSTGDPHGHGTHVASIVAGTGAAADGARRGVAHGARLLDARVLDDQGRGRASWVIAGMEWATEQGAEVANLSLGIRAGEGDDPVAQALDALTADTGTLFVVAAGNSGPVTGSVESPGIARSALTVGAAEPDGRPAFYSSAGPTLGTYRAKPDLMAPGSDITAARSGGGTAEPYTTMTGTSQATPHVAGAAALLREKHPGWSWQRVKSALMTTADGNPAESPSQYAGAGLLDLPGALGDTLEVGRTDADFGYLRHPYGKEPRTVEVPVTNNGTEPEQVTFTDNARDIHGAQAPAGLVTVSPAQVTVAPGETRRVAVTLTPSAAKPQLYSGGVVLNRAGGDAVTLPFNAYLEPPRHDVRLTVLDRRGEPWAGGTVWLGNMDDFTPADGGGFQTVQLDGNGQGTARMLPGPISMMAKVDTPAAGGAPASVALAGSPEVMLDGDLEYTIDARRAKPLDGAEVAGAKTRVGHVSLHYERLDARSGLGLGDGIYLTGEEFAAGRVFLQPTKAVRHGTVGFESRWRLDATGPRHGRQADAYELVLGGGPVIPDRRVYEVSRAEIRELARFTSDYRSLLGRPDGYEEGRTMYSSRISSSFVMPEPLDVPQRRTELVSGGSELLWRHCVAAPQAAGTELCTPYESYGRGERRAPVWFRGAAPAVIAGVHYAGSLALPVRSLSDGEHHGVVRDGDALGTESLRLYRDGEEIRPRDPGGWFFDVAPEPATYRLEHTGRPDTARLPIGTGTETSWTFPSRGPGDGTDQTKPRLLSVDYRPATTADGSLRAGRPLVMGARLVSADDPGDWRPERGTLRLWFSTDGGGQWHRAKAVSRPDGSIVAAAPGVRLRAGDSVSVRAEGSAAGGRAIDQTIIGAYPVR